MAVVTAAPPSPMPRFRSLWEELQDDLATLSSRSVHLIASKGGHHVLRDDPDTAATGIREVVRWIG